MNNPTELMQAILTSPKAQEMIDYVSPIYGAAYVALWMFQVIGLEWDEVQEWINELPYQAFPQTATWGIVYWERQYGIVPDDTVPLQTRRDRVMLKRKTRVPMNPFNIAKVAALAAGVDARVVENTAKNTFKVYLSALPTNVDVSAVTAAVAKVKKARLYCIIETGSSWQDVKSKTWSDLKGVEWEEIWS